MKFMLGRNKFHAEYTGLLKLLLNRINQFALNTTLVAGNKHKNKVLAILIDFIKVEWIAQILLLVHIFYI
jgi:hypothetical protein